MTPPEYRHFQEVQFFYLFILFLDFDFVMMVGARQGGLSISETAEMEKITVA